MTFCYPIILAGGLVPLIFGALWYSKPVYSAIEGTTPKGIRHTPVIYFISFVVSCLITSFIYMLMKSHSIEEQTLSHSLFHGASLSIFTIGPALLVHFMFEGDRSVRNMIYHILYWVITTALIGIVVSFCSC